MTDGIEDGRTAEPPFRWESLLESSRTFAQASASNYSVQDAAFFFLHAGASVELGVKAALCKVNPVLLIQSGTRHFDHALVSFVGHQPSTALKGETTRSLFTVSFDLAIKRFLLMYGDDALGVTNDELQALKAARDVTAHGGNVTGAASETLLTVLATLGKVHAALAPLLDTTPEEFWGSSFNLVSRAAKEQQDKVRHQVQALLTAANSRFQGQYGDVEPDALGAILMQAAERVQLTRFTAFRKCPVCSAAGVSHERPAKRNVIQNGRPAVERGWLATDFKCSVCKLNLPTEELISATTEFDPWDPANDDLVDIWADHMGAELDEADRELLEDLGYGP